MNEQDIRDRFASMRKLVQYQTRKDGSSYCQHEEDLVELAARQQRVPTELVAVDGWPTGGGGDGSRSADRTSITERSALQLTEPTRSLDDPVGKRIDKALNGIDMGAQFANTVRNSVTEALQLSSLRPAATRTVPMCESVGEHDEPCGEIAARKGRCNACSKWLYDHPDRTQVPRERITARNLAKKNKPKVYETGPYAEGA